MSFTPISINKYIKQYMRSNPKDDEKELRHRLESCLADYKNGKKCICGNDIWVIASASGENVCYTCLTGNATPTEDDFEIKDAIEKNNSGGSNSNSFSQLKDLFND